MNNPNFLKYYNLYFFCVLMIFVSSCNNNSAISHSLQNSESEEHIDLNQFLDNQNFSLVDILDSMKIVTLETNDESLVSNPLKIVATNNRIIIQDDYMGGGVIIFDNSGNYVRRLVNGNGPGELFRVISIGYDSEKDQILVLNSPFVFRYTCDGAFLESQELNFPCDNIISCNKNGYIFSKVFGHHCEKMPEVENFSLIVTDRDFNVSQLLLPYSESQKVIPAGNKGFSNGDGTVVTVPFSDTLYICRNNSVSVHKTIDFSSKKLDMRQFPTMDEYFKKVLITKEVSGFKFEGQYFETADNDCISLVSDVSNYTLFRNKNTGNIVSGFGCSYRSDEALPINNPIGTCNGWYYSFLSPCQNKITSTRYISQEDISKLDKVTPESNPFLVFFKLKQF